MTENAPEDDQERTGITRRRLVAAGAAGWATVSLAGCSRIADPGPPETNDGGGGDGGGGDGSDGDGGTDGGDGGTDGGDGGTDGGDGGTTISNETTATDDPGGQTTQTTTQQSCGRIRQFARGMEVGLHVDVFDDGSGEHLGADAIDSVTIEFPDADFEPLELNWTGDHERYSETSWGGKVVTSEDTEPGTYRYEITVEGEAVEEETIVDEFTVV